MRKVRTKVISSAGRVLGYYLEDSTELYSGEAIQQLISSREVEPFLPQDLYVEYIGEVDPNVDRSMVSICKMLKKFAGSANVTVDRSTHRTGFNTHLFKYLEYCGKDVDEFVCEYLYNLQPFMLQPLASQEMAEGLHCVVDTLYAVDMYIRVDTTDKSKKLVVAFHESNRMGIARSNRKNHKHDERVAIIPDTAQPVGDRGEYDLTFSVMRGLAFYKIQARGRKLGDCYSVRYVDISNEILHLVNDVLFDIVASDIPEELGFTDIRELTVTSFSNNEISVISMLIDAILATNNNTRKKYFTGALSAYIGTLPLTASEAISLEDTLRERYRVSDSKAIPGLLAMVTNGLHVAAQEGISKQYHALLESLPPSALEDLSPDEAVERFGGLIE